MHIVGFNTVFPFDYTNLGGIDLPLDNGNFTVSSNVVEINSEGLVPSVGFITFDPIDGYTLPAFTTEVLDVKGLPVAVTQGTLDHLDDAGVVLSTSGTLNIAYSPTVYQREFFVVRVTFASTPEQSIDIFVRLTSVAAAANFSTISPNVNFGDYFTNPTTNNVYPLMLTSQSLPIDPALVTVGISSNGALDTSSSFYLTYAGLAPDSLSITYSLHYWPFEHSSSDVSIQFYYNQVPVGDPYHATGTNSNVVTPAPMPMPDQAPFSSLLVYKNTSLSTYRITSVTLYGDTMGEYAIDNMGGTIDSVLLPNESIYVPLTYVQKQVIQTTPKLVLHGVYY